jgi:hypothetical protein
MLLNKEHKDFHRLYWNSNKKQIKEILSVINIKYLKGLLNKLTRNQYGTKGSRIYCRYSGYQFQVSAKTIKDELNKRHENSNTRTSN